MKTSRRLIAGSGRFPFCSMTRPHNLTVVVAIQEETGPEIDARAAASVEGAGPT
jgi:hypothetical protein